MLLVTSACASSGTSTASPSDSSRAAVRSSANLITAEDIAGTTARNMLEAVQQLRPRWLRQTTSDPRAEQGVVVKLTNDGRNHRDGPELDILAPHIVEWVQYFDPAAATVRFGWTHNRGVVLVKIRS